MIATTDSFSFLSFIPFWLNSEHFKFFNKKKVPLYYFNCKNLQLSDMENIDFYATYQKKAQLYLTKNYFDVIENTMFNFNFFLRKWKFFFNNLNFFKKRKRWLKKKVKVMRLKRLNFFFFNKQAAVSSTTLRNSISLFFFKKISSFWPLRINYQRLVFKHYNFLKNKKLSKIKYKAMILKRQNRGVWSFFGKFKAPKSKFHRSYDFSRRLMLIFWKSQIFYKTHHQPKRRWTARKFFYKFSQWYKINKKAQYSKSYLLWELFPASGMALSKYECTLLFSYNLIFSSKQLSVDSKIINNNRIVINLSPTLMALFKQRRSYALFLKKRFSKFQRTQYLNRLSQWRAVSKKKPKYLTNLLFKKVFNSNSWYFDPLSLTYFININTQSLKKTKTFSFLKPRHNLERLNVYKLKL